MSLSITLSDGTSTIDLPPELQWKDEFDWSSVEHSTDYSLTGNLVVQEGVKQDGRPITLYGGEEGAWSDREQVQVLMLMSSVPNKVMTLTLWGRTFNVMFRRPALEAKPLFRKADPALSDQYALTINLMEVNP